MVGGSGGKRSAFQTVQATQDVLLPIDTRLLPNAFMTAFAMPDFSTIEAGAQCGSGNTAGNAFRSPYALLVRSSLFPALLFGFLTFAWKQSAMD